MVRQRTSTIVRYAAEYLSWMCERLSNVLKKSKDSPVTSEYIESSMPAAAVTLKAWHLLDLSDMTFGYMDVEDDPLLPKEQRYWAVECGQFLSTSILLFFSFNLVVLSRRVPCPVRLWLAYTTPHLESTTMGIIYIYVYIYIYVHWSFLSI